MSEDGHIYFTPKQWFVEGVKVTEDNMEEVAEWCGGQVYMGHDHDGTMIIIPYGEIALTVSIGQWLLYANGDFMVLSDQQVSSCYDER